MISFYTTLALALPALACSPAQGGDPVSAASTADKGQQESEYVHDFEYVDEGEFDPASVPVSDGIVWYGTWEDAMAEKERTGKPIMLHMGSPRCPTTCVPGTW